MLYQKHYKNIWALASIIRFIDSFQCLSSYLDCLDKSLGYDDFKHLSQVFSNIVIGLVKEKGFCSHEYISNFIKSN